MSRFGRISTRRAGWLASAALVSTARAALSIAQELVVRLRTPASPRSRAVLLAACIVPAVVAITSVARADCGPQAANGVTATCTGTTTNQGGGAPGTSAGTDGYGTGVQTGVTVNVTAGAGNSVTGTRGIFLGDGTVINNTAASIAGTDTGILTGAVEVTNSGSITGAFFAGIFAATNATVTNNTGASITGQENGIVGSFFANVTNSGSITGTNADGIQANYGATVTNNAGASITGGSYGIASGLFTQFGSAIVTNSGSITGTSFAGIFGNAAEIINSGSITGTGNGADGIIADTNATVTNNAGASISGDRIGVYARFGFANVTNSGSITGTSNIGIYGSTDATVTNNAGASITGGGQGIYADTGFANVTNSGSITGTATAGIAAATNATVTNNAGASITGGNYGITAGAGGSSVFNAGSITGGIAAIQFAGVGNTLTLAQGSVITGNVLGTGSDTFQLGGAGSATFDVSQIGAAAQYRGFGTFNKIGSSAWTLTGTGNQSWAVSGGTLIGTTTSASGNIALSNNSVFGFDQNVAGSYSGTISGDGSLTKAGTGKVTLATAQAYTGSTTINAGTLSIGLNDALPAGTAVTINSSGTLNLAGFNQTVASLAGNAGSTLQLAGGMLTTGANDTSTAFSGTITGLLASGIVKVGTGTFTLDGNSPAFLGTTTVNGGTLALATNNAISASSAVNLAAGATLDVSVAGATITTLAGAGGTVTLGAQTLTLSNASGTFAGAINGSGGLRLNGGTETLTGTSTYAGSTTIDAGTLSIGINNALPTGTAVTVGASGILNLAGFNQTVASLAGNAGSTLQLAGATLTTGAGNTSTAFSGTITGSLAGGIVKTGTGTLTLAGTNTYTGATTVGGGTLRVDGSIAASSGVAVNSGGTLAGTGIVGNTTVNSGGTLAAGNGTAGSSLTVNGTLGLNAASTYAVNVNPATSSFANVSGAATLGGATVNAIFAPGSYVSKKYTILTAGSINGTFGTLTNTNIPPNFHDSLSYDATHAYLNLDLTFTTPAAGTINGNQNNVANALINFFNTHRRHSPDIRDAVGACPVASRWRDRDRIAAGHVQRHDAVHGPDDRPVHGGTRQWRECACFCRGRCSPRMPMPHPASRARRTSARPMPRSTARRRSPNRTIRAGASGAPVLAARKPPTAIRRSDPTPRTSRLFGVAAGADYFFSPNTVAGFALAGGGTSFSVNGLGSGRSDLFQAGAFVRHTVGPAYLTGALAYGWQDVTTDRTVTVAGIDRLRAQFNANAFSGRAEGRLSFRQPVDRRHRHHALRGRTVHHLRSARLCRAGGLRRQHLCAGLRREERHRDPQRTRPARRQILRDAERDPDPARPRRLGARLQSRPRRRRHLPDAARRVLRRERRAAGQRRRADHGVGRSQMDERLVGDRHLRRRVLQCHAQLRGQGSAALCLVVSHFPLWRK